MQQKIPPQAMHFINISRLSSDISEETVTPLNAASFYPAQHDRILAVAEALNTDSKKIVALDGPEGSGKTSIINTVLTYIAGQPSQVLWFTANRYSQFEEIIDFLLFKINQLNAASLQGSPFQVSNDAALPAAKKTAKQPLEENTIDTLHAQLQALRHLPLILVLDDVEHLINGVKKFNSIPFKNALNTVLSFDNVKLLLSGQRMPAGDLTLTDRGIAYFPIKPIKHNVLPKAYSYVWLCHTLDTLLNYGKTHSVFCQNILKAINSDRFFSETNSQDTFKVLCQEILRPLYQQLPLLQKQLVQLLALLRHALTADALAKLHTLSFPSLDDSSLSAEQVIKLLKKPLPDCLLRLNTPRPQAASQNLSSLQYTVYTAFQQEVFLHISREERLRLHRMLQRFYIGEKNCTDPERTIHFKGWILTQEAQFHQRKHAELSKIWEPTQSYYGSTRMESAKNQGEIKNSQKSHPEVTTELEKALSDESREEQEILQEIADKALADLLDVYEQQPVATDPLASMSAPNASSVVFITPSVPKSRLPTAQLEGPVQNIVDSAVADSLVKDSVVKGTVVKDNVAEALYPDLTLPDKTLADTSAQASKEESSPQNRQKEDAHQYNPKSLAIITQTLSTPKAANTVQNKKALLEDNSNASELNDSEKNTWAKTTGNTSTEPPFSEEAYANWLNETMAKFEIKTIVAEGRFKQLEAQHQNALRVTQKAAKKSNSRQFAETLLWASWVFYNNHNTEETERCLMQLDGFHKSDSQNQTVASVSCILTFSEFSPYIVSVYLILRGTLLKERYNHQEALQLLHLALEKLNTHADELTAEQAENTGHLHERLSQTEFRLNHQQLLALCCEKLANIYCYRRQFKPALPLIQKSAAAYEAFGDYRNAAALLRDLAMLYDEMGLLEKALQFYSQALVKAISQNDSDIAARILNNMGLIALERNQLPTATENFKQALAYDEQNSNYFGQLETLKLLAESHLEQGYIDTGIRYAKVGLSRSKCDDNNPLLVATFATILGQAFSLQGSPEKAKHYYKLALTAGRSILSEGSLAFIEESIALL